MCGLAGFSGKGNFDRTKMEFLLLWLALERGQDSTGIYSPKNNIIKSADVSYKFLRDSKMEYQEDTLFIGHVRAATMGNIIKSNAHPFNEGNVILAHNGTLNNQYDLSTKYNLKFSKYDVDSHVVCAALNEAQNFDPLSEIDGAASMLLADKNTPEILYVFKKGGKTESEKRTLFYGYINKDMYISSIQESLEFIGCVDVKSFEDDKLYTIRKGVIKSEKTVTNIPYKRPTPILSYEKASTASTITRLEIVNNLHLFKNCWIQASQSRKSNSSNPLYNFNITANRWYLVKDWNQEEKDFLIVDDDGVQTWLGMFSFNYDQSFLKLGTLVKILDNVTNRAKKKVRVFEENEICDILELDFKANIVVLKSKVDGNKYSIKTSTVRRLSTYEEQLWLNGEIAKEDEKIQKANILKHSCCNNVIGFNNKMGSSENLLIEHIPNNEKPTKEIITDEDNEYELNLEEQEASYFNLEVNDKRLAEVLDTQAGLAEDLLQFSEKLPEAEKQAFLAKIRKMETNLLSCSEEFNLTDVLTEMNKK